MQEEKTPARREGRKASPACLRCHSLPDSVQSDSQYHPAVELSEMLATQLLQKTHGNLNDPCEALGSSGC